MHVLYPPSPPSTPTTHCLHHPHPLPPTPPPSFCPPEVRSILLGLLHAADLGNSFKPVHLHAKWAVQVSQEFFREGEELRVRWYVDVIMIDMAQQGWR